MAIQRVPPPQQPKKSGMGCFGCGCLIVIVIFLLLVGLVGGVLYFGYKEIYSLTSTAPAPVPPFTGGDDLYAGAQKKIDAFDQDVASNKASSLTLGGDEINSLIMHDPDLTRLQMHLLATLTGDQARLQGSIPTNSFGYFSKGIPDRYLNFDATFGLTFNSDTKRIDTNLHKMQIGDTPVPESALPTMDTEFLPWIEMLINHYPAAKNAIAAATTIAIKDGQLVIETK